MKLELPFPPSVNNLFLNVRHGRVHTARYRKWIERANDAMWFQDKTKFDGPVTIDITVEDTGRADLDNLSKALLDHLVRHEIIQDDGRSVVRGLSLKWGKVKGAQIEILGA